MQRLSTPHIQGFTPAIPSQPTAATTSSTPAPEAKPQAQLISRSSALCTAADKVLKDIDQRLRSLPPSEAEEIKRQCDALLEARICLITRDEEDPTTLSDQRQDRMRTAIDTLRKTIPLSTPKSKQPQLVKRSGQFNAIQSTLNQLSRQLASELRATLREVQKESPAPPKLKNLSTVRDIVSALGAKDNKREMAVFLQSISSSLTLVQKIEQDSDKGLLIPPLVHNE